MSNRPAPAPAPTAGTDRVPAPAAKLPGDELAYLPVDLLQRGKYQPRVDMRQESLDELAASIKRRASSSRSSCAPSLAPRPVNHSATKSSRASALARRADRGPRHHPASSDACPMKPPIADGAHREHPARELESAGRSARLERLISEFGITHQQAADAVGRSRAAVSNLLRSARARARDHGGWSSVASSRMGHARATARLSRSAGTKIEIRRAGREEGPVGARHRGGWFASTLARAAGRLLPKEEKGLASQRATAAGRAVEKLGAPVQIQAIPAPAKGKVVVSYHSLDELDGIPRAHSLARVLIALTGCASGCATIHLELIHSGRFPPWSWPMAHRGGEAGPHQRPRTACSKSTCPLGATIWFNPRA
jgi:ParB family chromosome partitioning protein